MNWPIPRRVLKASARDALDAYPLRPQTWDRVIERYRPVPSAAPIVRLATAIKDSPYADLLYPLTSMFDIRVYQFTDEARYCRECLVIRYDFHTTEFEMLFYENSEVSPFWKKRCPAEESFSAFIHFLALKKWFAVEEIPRGSWTCGDAIPPSSRPD